MKGKVIIMSGAKEVIDKIKENKVCSLFFLQGRWRKMKENICPKNYERSGRMRSGKSISMSQNHCLSADDLLLFYQITKKFSSSSYSLKVFCRSPLHNRTEK